MTTANAENTGQTAQMSDSAPQTIEFWIDPI
jgi:hypothetical protein